MIMEYDALNYANYSPSYLLSISLFSNIIFLLPSFKVTDQV